jgi:hypothetical protein
MRSKVFPKLKSPDFKRKEVKNVYLFDLFLKKGVIQYLKDINISDLDSLMYKSDEIEVHVKILISKTYIF